MKRIVITALTLPVFLVGCGGGESVNNGDTPPVNVTDHSQIDVDGDTDTHIYKVLVEDTECVVVDGYQSVGVTCDWN